MISVLSGIQVKAGVYLLERMSQVFERVIGLFVINLGTTLSLVKYSEMRDPWVAALSLMFGLACLAGGPASHAYWESALMYCSRSSSSGR